MYAPECVSACCPAASRKYNIEETAEEAMAPQENEGKCITRSQVDPLPETSKLDMLLYDAYKPLVVNQMTSVVSVRSGQSVQPDVMTNVQTPL